MWLSLPVLLMHSAWSFWPHWLSLNNPSGLGLWRRHTWSLSAWHPFLCSVSSCLHLSPRPNTCSRATFLDNPCWLWSSCISHCLDFLILCDTTWHVNIHRLPAEVGAQWQKTHPVWHCCIPSAQWVMDIIYSMDKWNYLLGLVSGHYLSCSHAYWKQVMRVCQKEQNCHCIPLESVRACGHGRADWQLHAATQNLSRCTKTSHVLSYPWENKNYSLDVHSWEKDATKHAFFLYVSKTL